MDTSVSIDSSEAFLTTPGGQQLFERTWLPDNLRAAVVLVHGIAEHSGRHTELALHLAQYRIGVYTYDLRGHGRSAGKRLMVRSFDDHAADLMYFVEQAHARTTAPLFLLGHSMGGAISTYTCLKHPQKLDGLILSSPAIIFGEDVPAFVRTVGSWIASPFPRFPTKKINVGELSRTPSVAEDARQDPLFYRGRLPARTSSELLQAAAYIRQHANELGLPLLIVQGTADRIVDAAGSRLLHEGAGSPDKTLRMFEGFYHETYKDPGGEAVLNAISQWILERTIGGRT